MCSFSSSLGFDLINSIREFGIVTLSITFSVKDQTNYREESQRKKFLLFWLNSVNIIFIFSLLQIVIILFRICILHLSH